MFGIAKEGGGKITVQGSEAGQWIYSQFAFSFKVDQIAVHDAVVWLVGADLSAT